MTKRASTAWITLTAAVSVGLMVGGLTISEGFLPYASDALLQVGSTLLLVPFVFAAERVLSNRIEENQKIVRNELRNLGRPGERLRLGATWKDAHPSLEREWHVRFSPEVQVQLPDKNIRIGFSTTRQFNHQTQEMYSMVSIYFDDPGRESSQDAHILNWTEQVTLRNMIAKAETYLKNEGALSEKDKLEPNELMALLQEAVGPARKRQPPF